MDPINCKLLKKTQKTQKRSKRIKKIKRVGHIPESIKMPNREEPSSIISSYSPIINKFLVESRHSEKYDVFNAITECMHIPVEEYKLKDSILKYYLNPQIKTKQGECVSYWHKESQQLFLDNLSKHHNININSLIFPKQSYYNCWFNTGFMINYISDKGRKYNKYFRQYMITGKLNGFIPINKKLKAPLFLFNIAIEATLQGNILAKIMNTNDIIEKIYENIPKSYKKHITTKKQLGNPYAYQYALLNYLSGDSYINYFINGEQFYKSLKKNGFNNEKNDVMWIEFGENASREINNKEVRLTDNNNNIYELDSILIRDVTKNHFCCFVTINKEEYMYDGASSPSIKKIKWKTFEFLNKNNSIKMDIQSMQWNMRKGYQVLNYYRI